MDDPNHSQDELVAQLIEASENAGFTKLDQFVRASVLQAAQLRGRSPVATEDTSMTKNVLSRLDNRFLEWSATDPVSGKPGPQNRFSLERHTLAKLFSILKSVSVIHSSNWTPQKAREHIFEREDFVERLEGIHLEFMRAWLKLKDLATDLILAHVDTLSKEEDAREVKRDSLIAELRVAREEDDLDRVEELLAELVAI